MSYLSDRAKVFATFEEASAASRSILSDPAVEHSWPQVESDGYIVGVQVTLPSGRLCYGWIDEEGLADDLGRSLNTAKT